MRRFTRGGSVLLAVALALAPAVGDDDDDRLDLFGDFRFRLETDQDSRDGAGVERDDRTRARARLRLGFTYAVTPRTTVGARLRSGSDDSHQSPHITLVDFDDNDTGDTDFNLDRWYLKVRTERLWGRAGRHGFPFWKQNELLWDDDATLPGLAGGAKVAAGDGDLTATIGYFSRPVGMQRSTGNLAAAQLAWASGGDGAAFTVAGGLYLHDADRDDPDAALLLSGNGLRDYEIWSGSAQVRLEAGGRPLVLGADYMHNAEGYDEDDPDPFTASERDETDGYVLTVRWGSARERGGWQVRWDYARIESLAVNASYAQDDWVRWGTATETRSSNLEGHELRFAYGLTDRLGMVARLYLVESITTIEDGKRLRIDWNYGF